MIHEDAILVLADGSCYHGHSFGASGTKTGELVFNTSMTGYQEMLTDPSYAEQIITLTTAHVGNTGCNLDDMESKKAWANGLIVRNHTNSPSNYRATQSLTAWLIKQNVIAISGIDTRSLTIKLREFGALGACISTETSDTENLIKNAKAFKGLQNLDLASKVTRQAIERWHEGRGEWGVTKNPLKFHVVVYDFGVKENILRILYDLGCYLTIVPATTSVSEVCALNPDGVFLSNGPGDPFACTYAIENIKELLNKDMPLFGICLGFQLLGLACGAKSIKMKFGHHGANHPVAEVGDGKRVFITSQNHGFALDEKTLSKELEVTHRSLFDQSLQGIKHKTKAAYGFQGHPEASPGPHDIESIFLNFIKAMESSKLGNSRKVFEREV